MMVSMQLLSSMRTSRVCPWPFVVSQTANDIHAWVTRKSFHSSRVHARMYNACLETQH